MACPNNACNLNNTNTTSGKGYIYDTLVRIDQMQKAAIVENACEGCEGSLISAFYNTKPISIYVTGGTQLAIQVPSATIPATTTATTYFRIENVKNDAVVLRLLVLDPETGVYDCTAYTVVVRIECICSLQCFPPICCTECTGTCGAN